jgi:hypothetical protein
MFVYTFTKETTGESKSGCHLNTISFRRRITLSPVPTPFPQLIYVHMVNGDISSSDISFTLFFRVLQGFEKEDGSFCYTKGKKIPTQLPPFAAVWWEPWAL